MILFDNETNVDLLNNEAIARTIIKMLRHRPDEAVTFGVHGDWGAGKSSILEMIEKALEDDEHVVCLKFNGWRYQGFEDAKIALIEGIVTELLRVRPWSVAIKNKIKGLLKRVDYLKLARHSGHALWNMTAGLPSPGQVEALTNTFQRFADNPGQFVTRENIEGAVKSAGGYLKPAEGKRTPQEIEEFRKAFGALLKEAKIEQLVVLVDDLDRCLPETAIQTLEAIRLFVSSERTVFVIGADEGMIEYAVRRHFPDLDTATSLPRDYARNYLEKLIQVPFRLAALGEAETRIYVALLLLGTEIAHDDPVLAALINDGRERLKKPWAATPLDVAALRTALGSEPSPRLQELLILSDQIAPILARGFIGNPRQIKRFLNALLLRMNIADARGFETDVRLPVLAKLMLAERFQPTLFGQIAASASGASDGKCVELAEFERLCAIKADADEAETDTDGTGTKTTRPKSPDKATASESFSLASAWAGSNEIRTWGELSPKNLGSTDLRPYLFVAKDKRDFFAGSSVLARLGELITTLHGNKLAVRQPAVTERVTALAPTDATAVFNELRLGIIGAPDLQRTRPEGVEGLVVLVKTHPHLESRLLDLLGELPTDGLGAWVVGGWDECLRDQESKQRMKALLIKWSTSGSTMLRAAADVQGGTR
jgi:predicted KAP-like P-loop ATPase